MSPVSTLEVTKRRRLVPFASSALLIAAAFCLTQFATFPPHLVDQCDRKGDTRDSAAVVVVGVLTSDTLVSRPVPMHSDPTYHLQLRRLSIRVENVLKGAPLPEAVSVYYFTFADGFVGPRPLGFWWAGDRRIFWLRWDSGVLRTSCDGFDYCTEGVWSGAHPHYHPDPQKPLEYALVDLLFTRGEGIVNEIRFAREVDRVELDRVPGLQEYSVEKLRHLALAEHGGVKASACESLWIYAMDRVRPTAKGGAKDAMLAANCHCAEKPDLECQ